jgi:hypothetical protein
VLGSGVDWTVQLFNASALPVVRITATSTAITAATCRLIVTRITSAFRRLHVPKLTVDARSLRPTSTAVNRGKTPVERRRLAYTARTFGLAARIPC